MSELLFELLGLGAVLLLIVLVAALGARKKIAEDEKDQDEADSEK